MNDNADDRVDIPGYTLPPDSYDELLALRDSLIKMAHATYGPTAKGSLDPVPHLTSARLGHTFDHIAFQLLQAVVAATPTNDDVEEPSQPH
jgi:hypothetical protein